MYTEKTPIYLQVAGNAVEKFYLDLDLILQRFRQSGELHGTIPAKKLGNRSPWTARLRVVEGRVMSCQIFDNRDAVVNSGEPALDTLYKLGPLYWEIIPELPGGTGPLPAISPLKKPGSGNLPSGPQRIVQPPMPEPVPTGEEPVPSRLMNVSLRQMNQTQWPRDYRMVYILIDGKRSSATIARMLSFPLADVEQILLELQRMRIIEITP